MNICIYIKCKNVHKYQYQVLTVLELLPEYICVGVGAYFSCRFRMHIDFYEPVMCRYQYNHLNN